MLTEVSQPQFTLWQWRHCLPQCRKLWKQWAWHKWRSWHYYTNIKGTTHETEWADIITLLLMASICHVLVLTHNMYFRTTNFYMDVMNINMNRYDKVAFECYIFKSVTWQCCVSCVTSRPEHTDTSVPQLSLNSAVLFRTCLPTSDMRGSQAHISHPCCAIRGNNTGIMD